MAGRIQSHQRRSATLNSAETPFLIRYAGDIFFLLAFLVILFFIKPDPDHESHVDNDATEAPNPLEAMLISEDEDEIEERESSESDNKTR